MRLLAGIAIVALVSGQALAQRAAFTVTARPQAAMHGGHHFPAPIFWGGDLYPGYEVVQSSPQVIVLQAPASVAPVVKEEPKPITPLMIELQDGQYVRSGKVEKPAHVNVSAQPKPVPREIVPAVLIFRDGHREQVREYTVADGAIYAHGDYWTDGYWNRKILLSSLDVRATLSANQASGSNFELPSAPNIVIVHP